MIAAWITLQREKCPPHQESLPLPWTARIVRRFFLKLACKLFLVTLRHRTGSTSGEWSSDSTKICFLYTPTAAHWNILQSSPHVVSPKSWASIRWRSVIYAWDLFALDCRSPSFLTEPPWAGHAVIWGAQSTRHVLPSPNPSAVLSIWGKTETHEKVRALYPEPTTRVTKWLMNTSVAMAGHCWRTSLLLSTYWTTFKKALCLTLNLKTWHCPYKMNI